MIYFREYLLIGRVKLQMHSKRRMEFINTHLEKSEDNASQALNECQHLTWGKMQSREHLKPWVRNGNRFNRNNAETTQEPNMERTLDELQNMAGEKDGSGSTQLLDNMGLQNFSD